MRMLKSKAVALGIVAAMSLAACKQGLHVEASANLAKSAAHASAAVKTHRARNSSYRSVGKMLRQVPKLSLRFGITRNRLVLGFSRDILRGFALWPWKVAPGLTVAAYTQATP